MDFNELNFSIPIPEPIEIDTPAQHMWADEQFEILKKYIQNYENTLDSEHEVGLMMTNFGQSVLMVFNGYVNGKQSTLIQHINQLNFLLTSIKLNNHEEKHRIGFEISK